LLPRNVVEKYIIGNNDPFLLEYLSFDSRTLIEITDGLNKNNADRLEEYGE
jgi:hypothetical protein